MVSDNTRMRGTHLQKVQDNLLKELTATVAGFDKFNNTMSHIPEKGKKVTKTIALAITLLDIWHRFLFKRELKEQFSFTMQ